MSQAPGAGFRYGQLRRVLTDEDSRAEKACKIHQILLERYDGDLARARVLDVGCSAGLISAWLAD